MTRNYILTTLVESQFFSENVLITFRKAWKRAKQKTIQISSKEFWNKLYKYLSNVRYDISRNAAYTLHLKGFEEELTLLFSWCHFISKNIPEESNLSDKLLIKSVEKITYFLKIFSEGKAKFLSQLSKTGSLPSSFDKLILNKLIIETEGKLNIEHIFTRLNKQFYSYESIVFDSEKISIIKTTPQDTLQSHFRNLTDLLQQDHTKSNDQKKIILYLSDTLLSLKLEHLKRLIYLIKNNANRTIFINYFDIEGNLIAGQLSNSLQKKILTCYMKNKSSINSRINEFQRELTKIFAPYRTFVLTDDPSSWSKQARSLYEKLDLWINIEQTITSEKSLHKMREGVKEVIKKSFRSWETIQKHAKNIDSIQGIHIDTWIDCLKAVKPDSLGYQLVFNFNPLKQLKKRPRLYNFIDRFNPLESGTPKYVPNRWLGIIYDEIPTDKSMVRILRVRKKISCQRDLLRQVILARLEEIYSQSTFKVKKMLTKDPDNFLNKIWVDAGYPDFSEAFRLLDDPRNPLRLLKGKNSNVIFRAVEGGAILSERAKNFFKTDFNTSDAFERFFSNSRIILDVKKKVNEIGRIKSGKAFQYLRKKTTEEVPLPRWDKKREKWIFPSITAENPNSAAIRVFLDLISRSQKGRNVLNKINVITAKSMMLMNEKEILMSLNWGTGAYPSVEGLVTGMLDGVISVKYKREYIAEFIVEMIGERKAKLGTAAMFSSGPFSNILADILRIAVFGSAGIPGFVVLGEITESDLIYTLIYFDQIVLDRLRYAGANLAVDFNRPVVRDIIEESGMKKIISLYQKVFKTINVSAFPEDPHKFTTNKYSNRAIYSTYIKLLKIIVGKRDLDQKWNHKR